MRIIKIPAGETQTVDAGFNLTNVRNDGPGPVLIEGAVRSSGEFWCPEYPMSALVVTTFDEPVTLGMGW